MLQPTSQPVYIFQKILKATPNQRLNNIMKNTRNNKQEKKLIKENAVRK